MEIIGNKKFILKTKNALKLIKKNSPKSYNFVKIYIENIMQNNFSTLYSYEKIIYYVDEKIIDDEKIYASYILKEAFHSYLIQCSIKANKSGRFNCYNNERNRKLCNKYQIDILKELKVSEEQINRIKEKNKEKFNSHTIRIVGDKEFVSKVKSSLLLLKEKDYSSYKTVIQNLRDIVYFGAHESTYFDRFQERPTCYLNKTEHDGSVENMCGALLHEACHGKLYNEALFDEKNPDIECSGYSAEMYCLTREIECMKAVGADEELIQYYIQFYDIKWWKEPEKNELKLKH